MLSKDKYVKDSQNSQSYNRYSYAMNNPMYYNDPTDWLNEEAKIAQQGGNNTSAPIDPYEMAGYGLAFDEFGNMINLLGSYANGMGNGATIILDGLAVPYNPAILDAYANFGNILGASSRIEGFAESLVERSNQQRELLESNPNNQLTRNGSLQWVNGLLILPEGNPDFLAVNKSTMVIEGGHIVTANEFLYDVKNSGLSHLERGGRFDWYGDGGQGSQSDQGGDGLLSPSQSAYLSVIGGIVGSLKSSYEYEVKHYAVTAAEKLGSAKVASGFKLVGRGVSAIGIGAALYEFGSSDMSGADQARLAGSFIITGTAFIPFVGPLISIGLGAADAYGAFDGIYEYFDE